MIPRFLTAAIRFLILIYQRILNPMLKCVSGPGMGCRYTPSCSNYFLRAVEVHGPFIGSWHGIRRIFRCHPWGGCGYDPVPTPPAAENGGNPCSCHSKTPQL